jgi:hypothetical protein
MRFATAFLMVWVAASAAATAWAQNGKGNRNRSQNGSLACPMLMASTSLQPLSADETAKLLLIREEEKLALDMYQALYERWQLGIFSRIAASEKRHFDAVGALILRYGLPDPAQQIPGVFTNPDIQALYTNLFAQGVISPLDALKVGVAIEERDIEDLKAAIAVTDNKDILTVYGNLLNGSLNHLSAFNNHLEVASGNQRPFRKAP